MFGIGLPEMIIIMVVALIVVGPDKLPDLARKMAKGIFELKQTMNTLKESLSDEREIINTVQDDLNKTAENIKEELLDKDTQTWETIDSDKTISSEPKTLPEDMIYRPEQENQLSTGGKENSQDNSTSSKTPNIEKKKLKEDGATPSSVNVDKPV